MPVSSRNGRRSAPAVPADPIVVRPLGPSDIDEVVRIDSVHSEGRKTSSWERVAGEFLSESDDDRRVALAVDDTDGLTGFLLGEVRAFEFGSDTCGWIFAVGVDPDCLRDGVGSALLRQACRHFREAGVEQVRTMVLRNDIPVLSFFRANGFVGGSFVELELDLVDASEEGP